jgi:hypothetical protein
MKMQFVEQIKHDCNDYVAPVVVSNYLQEVGIMNSRILERIASEKNRDFFRSVEFFIALVVAISVLGFIFLAAL